MNSLRTEDKFDLFYDQVTTESSCLTEEPTLPRYRKMPRRYDDGSIPHQYHSPKDRYRHAYFEVLEVIAGEIKRRFDQPDLQIIKDIEQLVMNTSNSNTFDISENVWKYLENDIDCAQLKNHLLCFLI